jgi:5-methylcytosine-specific restriction endonuclease McrA
MPKGIRKGQQKLSEDERIARRKNSGNKWREKNREMLRAKARARYASDPEREKNRHKKWASKNLAHLRKYNQKKYQADPEIKKVRARGWRRRNPEYAAMASARYAKNNPEIIRECNRAAGIHRRSAPGKVTPSAIREIRILQKGKCAYCRRKVTGQDEHVDHIIAIKNGGTHDRSNLQILCERCNKRKSWRDPIEFVRSEYGLLL